MNKKKLEYSTLTSLEVYSPLMKVFSVIFIGMLNIIFYNL